MRTTKTLPPRLVWVDLETTGLDAESKSILEIAIVITDGPDLSEVARYEQVIPTPLETLTEECDDWCTKQHKASGLWDECLSLWKEGADNVLSSDAAHSAEAFLGKYNATGLPMAGATIAFDRGFIARHMPYLGKAFHYRSLDVSTYRVHLPILGIECPPKKETHRAMADILESIELARWVGKRLA